MIEPHAASTTTRPSAGTTCGTCRVPLAVEWIEATQHGAVEHLRCADCGRSYETHATYDA